MISTSALTFTGSVPESITGGISAGQGSRSRYRSRLEMNRISGLPDLRVWARKLADLRSFGRRGVRRGTGAVRRVVPNLYRTRAGQLALATLAAFTYGALLHVGHGLAVEWDRPNLASKGSAIAIVFGVLVAASWSRRLGLSSREVTR